MRGGWGGRREGVGGRDQGRREWGERSGGGRGGRRRGEEGGGKESGGGERCGSRRGSEFELAQCNLYLYTHLPLSSSPPFFPPPTFFHLSPFPSPFSTSLLFPPLFPPLSFSLPFSHLSPFPLFSCAPIDGSYHVHLTLESCTVWMVSATSL